MLANDCFVFYGKDFMNSRELVNRAVEFDKPSRFPRDMWALPYANIHHPEQLKYIQSMYPADIVMCPVSGYKVKPLMKGDAYAVGSYTDEWGCVFENRQAGIIGEVKYPILKDLSNWDEVRIPSEMLTFDIDGVNDFCDNSDKFVLSGCYPRPFERLQFIRGSANVYMDLGTMPSEIVKLLDKIHNFNLEELELWAKTKIDALFIMDDWGSQLSLLISPAMWREVFKPLYKDYVSIAHSHNKKIFMHSDGNILDIFPDLIELGIDAVNSQIFCIGVDKLEQFKGKITFWGEIDRQHILRKGTIEEVKDAVELVKDKLYEDGGVIAQCEFGPGGNPENVKAVFEQWDKYNF
jgi:uroporphyrinogen decarboxylase